MAGIACFLPLHLLSSSVEKIQGPPRHLCTRQVPDAGKIAHLERKELSVGVSRPQSSFVGKPVQYCPRWQLGICRRLTNRHRGADGHLCSPDASRGYSFPIYDFLILPSYYEGVGRAVVMKVHRISSNRDDCVCGRGLILFIDLLRSVL